MLARACTFAAWRRVRPHSHIIAINASYVYDTQGIRAPVYPVCEPPTDPAMMMCAALCGMVGGEAQVVEEHSVAVAVAVARAEEYTHATVSSDV